MDTECPSGATSNVVSCAPRITVMDGRSPLFPNRHSVHCQPVSIPVPLQHLDAAVAERGTPAYVLTVSDRGTPHVVHADVIRSRAGLLASVGAGTAHNASCRTHVSLLYPSRRTDDYSLIIDAVATVLETPEGRRLCLAATRAVLHRSTPAPDPAAAACGSDCIPLSLGEDR